MLCGWAFDSKSVFVLSLHFISCSQFFGFLTLCETASFSVIFIQHLLTFCQLTFPLLETNNGPKRLRVFRVFYARRVKSFFSISVWVIMFICSIALSHLGPSHLMMWITPQNFLPFTIKMAADIGSNKGEEVTSTKRDKQSKSNKNTHLNDEQNKMSA